MLEYLLVALVSIIVLGVSAQWIAWRYRLPSILILLLFGFVAGPITGFLVPDELFGGMLFPVVSLSVALILFEGGLSLRLEELPDAGRPVRNLVTVGVCVTWIGAALGAFFLAGLNLPLSILVGALLVVTGPTVIVPLLRHIRPKGRAGAVTKWEGIVVDPIGAILSVLVLEIILFLHRSDGEGVQGGIGYAILQGVEGLVLTTVVSLGVALLGTGILVLVFHRRHVPDFLQNPVVLMVVSAAFAVANLLQAEAGLMAVTLMGVMMANQDYVPVRRISEFEENLRVLLIGGLFIVLSARLQVADLQYLSIGSLLFLAALMVVVRPAAVFLSSIGTDLNWKEKAFLAFMAPRGIVAAAVISLFSFRLSEVYPEEAGAAVPIVFLVIVGTVTIYGLGALPLARYLGLADPDPQGVLFVGAQKWAVEIARRLHEAGVKVFMIDDMPEHVEIARQYGVPASKIDVLAEDAIDALALDGIGRLLALTGSEKANSLAAVHFYEIFDSTNVYQLSVRENGTESGAQPPKHLRGHPLFGEEVTYSAVTNRLAAGGRIESVPFEDAEAYEAFTEQHADGVLPLLLVRENGAVYVYSDEPPPTPRGGGRLIALVDQDVARQDG